MGPFPQFSQLPLEIRLIVWEMALPHTDRQSVYVFSRRYYPFYLQRDSIAYDEGLDWRRAYVQVTTPGHFFVNREARAVAVRWLASYNLDLVLRKETNGHVVAREWSPFVDELYVPHDDWIELFNLANRPDFRYVPIRHLALSAFTAYRREEAVVQLLAQRLPSLLTISIIEGEPPPRVRVRAVLDEHGVPTSSPLAGRRDEVHQRWELEDVGNTVDEAKRLMFSQWVAQTKAQHKRIFPFGQSESIHHSARHIVDPETGEPLIKFFQVKAVRR